MARDSVVKPWATEGGKVSNEPRPPGSGSRFPLPGGRGSLKGTTDVGIDYWSVRTKILDGGTGPLKARLLWKSRKADFLWDEFSRSANTRSSRPPLRTRRSI